ncbi:MAG: helix-hairpin-helix domain-containing protein [Acidobacteria bacterium]|nr:helix-hairpin-helix domain-containing protein [Acidobacteriota bacterium]
MRKRDYGTNGNNGTNGKINFRLFRYFRLFRNLSCILILLITLQTAQINVNTATIEELMRLPGIGPALAARIVEHRSKHGVFKRPQEIIIVRGMSARRYRQIAHLIRI